MKKIEITLTRSLIGRKPNQVKTAHALGLRNINSVVVREANETILGMVKTISHLVSVKEI